MKKGKKLIIGIISMGIPFAQLLACPVCERNQPKLLRGLVHGPAPEGALDYIIVGIVTVISLVALWLSIKKIFKPGEQGEDHIKRCILNRNDHE